jgi:hypothetical protein
MRPPVHMEPWCSSRALLLLQAGREAAAVAEQEAAAAAAAAAAAVAVAQGQQQLQLLQHLLPPPLRSLSWMTLAQRSPGLWSSPWLLRLCLLPLPAAPEEEEGAEVVGEEAGAEVEAEAVEAGGTLWISLERTRGLALEAAHWCS